MNFNPLLTTALVLVSCALLFALHTVAELSQKLEAKERDCWRLEDEVEDLKEILCDDRPKAPQPGDPDWDSRLLAAIEYASTLDLRVLRLN